MDSHSKIILLLSRDDKIIERFQEKLDDNLLKCFNNFELCLKWLNLNSGSSKTGFCRLIIHEDHLSKEALTIVSRFKQLSPAFPIFYMCKDVSKIQDKSFIAAKLIGLGIYGIYPLPWDIDKIITSVMAFTSIMVERKSEQKNTLQLGDRECTAVNSNLFLPGNPVLFDTYLRLSSGRYVKIINKNESLSIESFKKYCMDKKVEKFFILTSDCIEYAKTCNELSNELLDSQKYHDSMQLCSESVDKIIENVYCNGLNEESVNLGKEVCRTITEKVIRNADYKELIAILNSIGADQMSHSYLVVFLVNMISEKFLWSSDLIVNTINLAGLFHDIGKTKLPPELRTKHYFTMSKTERELYEQHPIWGAEILTQHKFINQTVVQIVLQHHENINGTGFPHGIKGQKILILGSLIGFCDQLAKMMVSKKIGPVEALNLMITDPEFIKQVPYEIIDSFCQICSADTYFVKSKLSA